MAVVEIEVAVSGDSTVFSILYNGFKHFNQLFPARK